jgi:hypothetical protein
MTYPGLEEAIVYSISHYGLGSSVTLWEYEMALEIQRLRNRISDMALGCEVDETHLPKSPAENPV